MSATRRSISSTIAVRRDVLIEAYSPVAHGAALEHPVLVELAAKYGVGVAQLCIRYCLQLGLLPLPKSTNADHMRSNAAVDFEIGGDDMATLKGSADAIDYGEASAFPVFGKPRQAAGSNPSA